jgi:hypothetical protein
MRRFWCGLLLLAAPLGGCGDVAQQGAGVSYRFGLVRVHDVTDSAGVRTRQETTLGVKVSDGVGVGYIDERRVYVPLTCSIVVLVKTREQLDHAVERLSSVAKRSDLCVALQ